jgi:hypothetical protein
MRATITIVISILRYRPFNPSYSCTAGRVALPGQEYSCNPEEASRV